MAIGHIDEPSLTAAVHTVPLEIVLVVMGEETESAGQKAQPVSKVRAAGRMRSRQRCMQRFAPGSWPSRSPQKPPSVPVLDGQKGHIATFSTNIASEIQAD